MPLTTSPKDVPPEHCLYRLVAGNRRFLQRNGTLEPRMFRRELADRDQRPFAIVLGCSDSRTPVEIVFDQGFGDLFVVRIAGNIVAPSVVGSIEYAATQLGARLVVVLGHTRCGAIAAAAKAIDTGEGPESRNIRAITDRITPHIEDFLRTPSTADDAAVLRECMRANVRASADHLRYGSRLLQDLVSSERIAVVGAQYDLETGEVDFFDGVPLPLHGPTHENPAEGAAPPSRGAHP